MNNAYVARAKEVLPDPRELIVIAMRRANQLANGAKPLIRTNEDKHVDVALLEIAEGLIIVDRMNEAAVETDELDELSSVLDEITI